MVFRSLLKHVRRNQSPITLSNLYAFYIFDSEKVLYGLNLIKKERKHLYQQVYRDLGDNKAIEI